MTFFHNWQRLFSYEYRVETAAEQAIIDELRALRAELHAFREGPAEPQYRTEMERRIYEGMIELERKELEFEQRQAQRNRNK